MDYAVSWDLIFPDTDHLNHERREANMVDEFQRLILGIQPDIVCLQEINPIRDPYDVLKIFDDVLPLENGDEWQGTTMRDNFIISRFPLKTDGYDLNVISGTVEIEQAAALVDLPDAEYGDTDLYVICTHFRSGGAETDRINGRIKLMESSVKSDLKTSGDYIDLKVNTPLVIAGDFNVFYEEEAPHLTTILTGNIFSENHMVLMRNQIGI